MDESARSEAGRALSALRPVKRLICQTCGKPFQGRGRAKFCSDRCRWDWINARRRAERKAAREGEHGQ